MQVCILFFFFLQHERGKRSALPSPSRPFPSRTPRPRPRVGMRATDPARPAGRGGRGRAPSLTGQQRAGQQQPVERGAEHVRLHGAEVTASYGDARAPGALRAMARDGGTHVGRLDAAGRGRLLPLPFLLFLLLLRFRPYGRRAGWAHRSSALPPAARGLYKPGPRPPGPAPRSPRPAPASLALPAGRPPRRPGREDPGSSPAPRVCGRRTGEWTHRLPGPAHPAAPTRSCAPRGPSDFRFDPELRARSALWGPWVARGSRPRDRRPQWPGLVVGVEGGTAQPLAC